MEAELPRVLIVAGDADLVAIVTVALRAWGMSVLRADNVVHAGELLQQQSFDVVILDWGAPPEDRSHLLGSLTTGTRVPIIAVNVDIGGTGEVSALGSGVAGYLATPVDPFELVQRVRRVIGRAEGSFAGLPHGGPWGLELVYTERRVLVKGHDVELTPREFSVLALLLARRGEVLSVEELALGAWGHETLGDRNYVEALVSRLRAKLGRAGAGRVILTRRGFGYLVPRTLPESD